MNNHIYDPRPLDLLASDKKREEAEERRHDLFKIFLQRNKSYSQKRLKQIAARIRNGTTDAFEKALENLSAGLKKIASTTVKTSLSQHHIEQMKDMTPRQRKFASATALGKAELALSEHTEKLNVDDKEKLRLKFDRAKKTIEPDFIGPLPEAFEKARRHNDVSSLRHEFAEYSDLLAQQNQSLHFESIDNAGFVIIFQEHAKPESIVHRFEPPQQNQGALQPVYIPTRKL